MGLFDFLRKGNKTTKVDAILIEGDQRVNVVGESQYQDALAVVLLVEEEQAEADRQLEDVLAGLGLGGRRHAE